MFVPRKEAKTPDPIDIVVADDHAIVREGLRGLLQSQPDFRVVGEAANGLEALRQARELRPDVLLLDVSMPTMSGLQALRELANSGPPVRSILVTATIDRAEIVSALQLGARGVVLKDAPSQVLFKAVRTVMAGELWVGREVVCDLLAVLQQLSTNERPAAPPRSFGLTPRQLEIITYVAEGLTNKEIAKKAAISEQTVKHHLSLIFDKTGVSSRLELALFAAHHGLPGSSS